MISIDFTQYQGAISERYQNKRYFAVLLEWLKRIQGKGFILEVPLVPFEYRFNKWLKCICSKGFRLKYRKYRKISYTYGKMLRIYTSNLSIYQSTNP